VTPDDPVPAPVQPYDDGFTLGQGIGTRPPDLYPGLISVETQSPMGSRPGT
jgi:hypothetical protein